MMPASATAKAVLDRIVDFALPPRCPACGAVTQAPHRFCMDCWAALTFLGEPCCERCALPFEYESDGLCAGCIADPPPFDRLRAAVAYGEIARQVALKLKYSGRPGVARTLALLMQRHLGDGQDAILVPVPLHRWRIWRRGYNQAALIATELARRSGIPAELGLLRRIKSTPSLRGRNRRERALAVRGAFAASGEAKARLAGRRAILIDDIYTSGATARACAKALKRAGAERVDILCWARVVRATSD